MGRRRAYVICLLAYAVCAVAMMLIGGPGASLLLPAMQSLIHG